MDDNEALRQDTTMDVTEKAPDGTLHKRPGKIALLAALAERDGDECFYCHKDFSVRERTIDHYYPQSVAFAEGWTYEQVWAMSNLRLACKQCNSKKGDRIPRSDGTIPKKLPSSRQLRRERRANRPEICTACNNGRLMMFGQVCVTCGSGPNEGRYPKWRQMPPKDCDHDDFYCVACTVWFPDIRRSALETLADAMIDELLNEEE